MIRNKSIAGPGMGFGSGMGRYVSGVYLKSYQSQKERPKGSGTIGFTERQEGDKYSLGLIYSNYPTGNYWTGGIDMSNATAGLNGGSGQYFLSPKGYWKASGYYFLKEFKDHIGINTLQLKSPELNAFQHLGGYSAMALGGLSIKDLIWRMNEHEKDETGLDTKIDQLNNNLVINKYIPALNALNKTFADPYSYSIEVIKLMQSIGYYRSNANKQAQLFQLTPTEGNRLIQILESLKP